MKTNDDNIKWVVERLQALNQEHEEARRADRVVDHAACRIASETCLQELLRAYDQLDEARAEIEVLRVELQRAYDAKSQQAVYAGEHANRAEAYRVACLQAEVEVDRLRAEIQPRIERSIAFQDAMEEAEAERDEARAEVERLKAERDAAHREGQKAMRERCAALCSARYVEHEKRLCSGPPAGLLIAARVGGMVDEAEQCAEAIRAMEVE